MSDANRAVSDFYRCPGEMLGGKFHIGAAIDEYEPKTKTIAKSVVTSNRNWSASEFIDHLRWERYVNVQKNGAVLKGMVRRAYYSCRPFLGVSIRRPLQQFWIRGWQDIRFPKWPVDCTVERVCSEVMTDSLRNGKEKAIPFIWFWPCRANACVIMTHDVETQVGLDCLNELMNLDDSFGIKASFQLVPEKRYFVAPSILAEIRHRGFEINVQDLNHDGMLYATREQFLRRANLINMYRRRFEAHGFRAAVLYRRPEWYADLDFSYDMSIPTVGHLSAQRGGCCTVMPYFIGNVLELPVTTTEDYGLLHLLSQSSIDLWVQQVDLIIKNNGLISFIVHPDYILEKRARTLYEKLLALYANIGITGISGLRYPVMLTIGGVVVSG